MCLIDESLKSCAWSSYYSTTEEISNKFGKRGGNFDSSVGYFKQSRRLIRSKANFSFNVGSTPTCKEVCDSEKNSLTSEDFQLDNGSRKPHPC